MFAVVYPQFYGVQGIARYLDSFLANLPEECGKVYLVTGDAKGDQRTYRNVEIINIPAPLGRFGLLIWMWKARKVLQGLHRQGLIRQQVFHWPPLISGLILPKTIPLVTTVHTTYVGMTGRYYGKEYFKSQWGGWSFRVKFWMENLVLKNTQTAIVLTEQGKQELNSYRFDGNVEIIPNGVDVKAFNPIKAEKKFDVIFAGRIESRKGSAGIANICKELIAIKPDVKIVIVGYGEDEESVKRSLAEYPSQVLFAGKRQFKEMQEFYAASKVYVATSYYEGLPGTCIEAMAMEIPPVVWDFEFYQGLVSEGETGYIAPPNDFRAMAQKVLMLLQNDDLRVVMGSAARAKVLNEYDWGKIALRVVSAIERTAFSDKNQ